MANLKLYVVFSKEAVDKMKGNRGKLTAQGGHGYLHAFWDAEKRFPEIAEAYRNGPRATKIALLVATENQLEDLVLEYGQKCGCALIQDAGLTVFDEPTITCLGLGPIDCDKEMGTLTELPLFI